MKRIFILACIVFICHASDAQTKKIAHRSHSGSNKTFTAKGESNFGGVYHYSPEEKKRIDSLRKEYFRKDSIQKIRQADSLKKAIQSPKIPIVKKKKPAFNSQS
jgi:hypothetical protein